MNGFGDSRPSQRGESYVAGNHRRNVQGKRPSRRIFGEWHHTSPLLAPRLIKLWAGRESPVNSGKRREHAWCLDYS